MSLRVIGALTRASWFQARSYRLSLALQVGGLVLSIVPTWFIANALQDTLANSIANEAEQYFAFVIVGSIALMIATTSLTTLHGSIAGGISSGYFEALLMTRASLPSLLVGLTSYGLVLTLVRGTVVLVGAWLLGARLAWGGVVPAIGILALLAMAHWGIGLVATALVIAFRTAGPLVRGVTILSTLFGGVYFPTTAIPSFLGAIAAVTPLAYGLRAMRKILLQGQGMAAVSSDVLMLGAMTVVLLAIGAVSLQVSLRYARKAGTLGSY